ncbi:hypothetical protein BG006_005621 [Podila minutissima]|uniref:Uncharacterized protein n=1 Tax=Podila minutissima TaxID=64525 RepID=A0A9P5SJS4_9FUNG|nr:hypothetical protein BG006_005621 [Podila minutissima]
MTTTASLWNVDTTLIRTVLHYSNTTLTPDTTRTTTIATISPTPNIHSLTAVDTRTTPPTHQITPQRLPPPNIGRILLLHSPTALLRITQCQHQGRVSPLDIRITPTITLDLLGKLPTLAIQPILDHDRCHPHQGHPDLSQHILEPTERTLVRTIIHAILRHRNPMDRRLQGLSTTILILAPAIS